MENYNAELLKKSLDNELSLQKICGKVILDRFCLIDESSRKSPAYIDPNYSGFYYHLGKFLKPSSMMEIGFDLGLLSGSFLTSCKTVNKFFGLRESTNEYVSMRLGKQNIKKAMKGERDFYIGSVYDKQIELFLLGGYDLILITEQKSYDKHLEYFDFAWSNLSENGVVVIEYLDGNISAKKAFMAFCKSKSREALVFKTRYGTGLVQK